MKKIFKLLILVSGILFLFLISGCMEKNKAALSEENRKAIRKAMDNQQKCWNNGNIDCFMEGYWKSDSLRFIGKNGITYGWKKTMANYKNSYPSHEAMGDLKFDIISLEALGEDKALLIGKWHLERVDDSIGGHFTLIWKKFNNNWKIILDHTS